jgi:rhamnosyl/mannosyltransferase
VGRLSVVHAAKFFPPVAGGMETVVADLCHGTAADWDVGVIAAHTERRTARERSGRVLVTRSGLLASAHSVPLCPTLPLRLWMARADCVVLHEPNPLAGSSLFVRTPARHLVVWHHSDLVRPRWAPYTYGLLQRALYRRADCVIVSSPDLARESALVGEARRVEVVPFGVPLDRFRDQTPARLAAMARIRALAPGPIVLFVGRFVYYKGVHVLLDAMTRCPGTLVLVGEGPLEGALRQQVRDRGLGERAVFAGRVAEDELPAYYQAADLFVLPSIARTEAFGVVQAEAMAAGVPVVSTRLPTGVPWVNQDGVTGFVVPPGDDVALAGAMNRVLLDPALREALGRGAWRRAGSTFDRRAMVARFKRIVEEIAGLETRVEAPLAEPTVACQ